VVLGSNQATPGKIGSPQSNNKHRGWIIVPVNGVGMRDVMAQVIRKFSRLAGEEHCGAEGGSK